MWKGRRVPAQDPSTNTIPCAQGLSLPSVRKQVQPAYARPRAEVEAYARGRAQSALPASEWREYSEYG